MPGGFYTLHFRLAIISDFHSAIVFFSLSRSFLDVIVFGMVLSRIHSPKMNSFRFECIVSANSSAMSAVPVYMCANSFCLWLSFHFCSFSVSRPPLLFCSFRLQSHKHALILPIYLFIMIFFRRQRCCYCWNIWFEGSKGENKTNLILMQKQKPTIQQK